MVGPISQLGGKPIFCRTLLLLFLVPHLRRALIIGAHHCVKGVLAYTRVPREINKTPAPPPYFECHVEVGQLLEEKCSTIVE